MKTSSLTLIPLDERLLDLLLDMYAIPEITADTTIEEVRVWSDLANAQKSIRELKASRRVKASNQPLDTTP